MRSAMAIRNGLNIRGKTSTTNFNLFTSCSCNTHPPMHTSVLRTYAWNRTRTSQSESAIVLASRRRYSFHKLLCCWICPIIGCWQRQWSLLPLLADWLLLLCNYTAGQWLANSHSFLVFCAICQLNPAFPDSKCSAGPHSKDLLAQLPFLAFSSQQPIYHTICDLSCVSVANGDYRSAL